MMQSSTTLAEIAATRPGATRVFQSLGLDFCCGGHRPLDEACRARGLDTAAVLAALERAEPLPLDVASWTASPIPDLVGFIVGHYHRRLREEIPALVALAEKVERVHAEKSACPRGLAEHLKRIHVAVLDHLEKEERVLFPMILDGAGGALAGPIHAMEAEHDDHGENLRRTRDLTADLAPPAEACGSWRALYARLAELESELHDHIHLENNVLFPRALGERL